MNKKINLKPGQTLRYSGRVTFPGFDRAQPYMVFIAHHNAYQILVKYNGIETIVEKFFTDPVE